MVFKNQIKKLTDNWLIIVIVVVALVVMNSGSMGSFSSSKDYGGMPYYASEGMLSNSMDGYSGSRGVSQTDFAPEIEVRKITKSASMNSEVKNGEFSSAEQQLKSVLSSSDSYILNENVNKYGATKRQYYQGSYSIRVDTSKYDAVVSQLKGIGEITSFRESATDVTGQYSNAQINLETEKSRLERYEEMYDEATQVSDKLTINDRIFDQERRIKYLEDAIKNIDQRIEYTTISFTLIEKQSSYANVVMVKFSSLIENLVESCNALLSFLFIILPWGVLALLVLFIWRLVKKK